MSVEPPGASPRENIQLSPSRDFVPVNAPTQHGFAPEQCEDHCLICQDHDLARPGADVARLACAHAFCFPCIERWSAVNPTCPLCSEAFTMIHRDAAASVSVLPASERRREPAETQANDFDCLDHGYFLEETSRLLLKVDTRLADLRARHRTSVWEDRSLDVLREASVSLHAFRATLLAFERFEAWTGLQQLYAVQEVLQAVWEGPGAKYWDTHPDPRNLDDAGAGAAGGDEYGHRPGALTLDAVFTVKHAKKKKKGRRSG